MKSPQNLICIPSSVKSNYIIGFMIVPYLEFVLSHYIAMMVPGST